MGKENWCRHYRGLSDHETCNANVVMMDLATKGDWQGNKFPCFDPEVASVCSLHEPYTAAEIQASRDAITKFVKSINDFWARKTEACPHCGKHVESVRQVGRCVYASPCNCRIGQGTVPKAWNTGS